VEAIERLGAQIRRRRQELDLTQTQVADRLGISRSQLSRLESGRSVTLHTLFDVAFDLGLDIIAVPRGSRASNDVRADFPDQVPSPGNEPA